MFTEAQIDNVFRSTGTSFRQNGKRNGGVRLFDVEIVDARSHKPVHKIENKASIEAGVLDAVDWLIKNRNGSTVAPGTTQATESRVSQLEAELAKTNEMLAKLTAAQSPAPAASSEDGEPKRARRKKEPAPERADDDTNT